MSLRPRIPSYPVIVDGNMASASLTSRVTIIQELSMVSYAFSWAGTAPVGAISVEVSNDYSQNSDGSVKNSGTWTAITFSLGGSSVSSAPVSGNTGNGFIDIVETAAYAMRAKYTKTSGVGTLQAVLSAKVA